MLRAPRRGAGRRVPAVFAALVFAAIFLAGCDSVAPALACKVQVDTPQLVHDREAAGIADCTWADAARGTGASPHARADLPDLKLPCLGSTASTSLSDIRGPAVLNFWSTTCTACREEMPVLQQFSERYGHQVPMIGVNYLDLQPEMAIDFARRSGVTYPSVADPCGDLQETDAPLAIGLPFFLFIHADGTVSTPHTGGLTTLQQVVDLVEKSLDVDLSAPVPKGTGSSGSPTGAS